MKHNSIGFVIGVLVGIMLMSCTAFAAAAAITATRTTTPVYVDGKLVNVEAYNIGGYNFFKLRDLGKLVDFGVSWDSATRSVRIDTTTGYTEAQNSSGNAGPTTTPSTGEQFAPYAGEVISCDDGTAYTITDVSRWDSSAFSAGPVGALPAATCDWSQFPKLELPSANARHFRTESGNYLCMRNLYETRRMIYTLYNAVGQNPEVWENGALKLSSKGNPLVKICPSIPTDKLDSAQSFWPWRSADLLRVFESVPIGSFYVEAWDMYKDGVFLYTEYYVYAP
jgi:hypothetical protein